MIGRVLGRALLPRTRRSSGPLLLVMMLSCSRRDAAEGPAPSVQPQAEVAAARVAPPKPAPPPAPPSGDVGIATRWVDALREGNAGDLQAYARYPFELHDDGGSCPPRQTTSRPEDLTFVLSCLTTDNAVIDLLRRHDSGAVEPLPDHQLAAWQKKWHVSSNPDMHVVTAFYNRNDARTSLDLWIADGGVRGVWRSGVSGAGAIGIATRWLDAVRHENLEQLAQLTRYPFEVRDTGRDAHCKKKVAYGRDTLEPAVSCLLHSDLLHRALTDSTSSRMLADGQPPTSLAEWARPWWREKDHAGLQSVYTMVATTDGYEFDFQILVDHDGVRAVWKSGSFESRK